MAHCIARQVLFTQGFGTRRECEGLIAAGFVRLAGTVCDDPWHEVDTDGLVFGVRGPALALPRAALVLLHKPAGYECSQKPKHHPSVLSLLPRAAAPPRRAAGGPARRRHHRPAAAHRRRHADPPPHLAEAPRAQGLRGAAASTRWTTKQVDALLAGVVLDDDPKPVRAAACEAIGTHGLRLTLTEGKYHQVKRMVAAAGNRVEALHRSAFGALALPADLAPGQWRWLDGPQVLTAAPTPPSSSR